MKRFQVIPENYLCRKYTNPEEHLMRANQLINQNTSKYDNTKDYKKMFSLIDYTTLDVADTKKKVEKMVEFVNKFKETHPTIPPVAAICVYPPFVSLIREKLTNKEVGIACVTGGFPASQTLLEVKFLETKIALDAGATEIDIVLPVGKFLEQRFEEIFQEISMLKQLCGKRHLKVILEVDSLKDYNLIYNASMLSMDAGADFIKTSTGKVDRDSAAFESRLLVMCDAIKEFNAKHGVKIALKPAGGMKTAEHALRIYTLVSEALGAEYQSKELFRLGASSLADALIKKIKSGSVSII